MVTRIDGAHPTDDAFVSRVVAAADDAVDALDDAPPLARAPLGPHREAMRRAKLLVAAFLAPGGRQEGDTGSAARALEFARALREMQTASGLFAGGDNLESPPDSGFTINDVGDILELIARAPEPARCRTPLADVHEVLHRVIRDATPALLAGGVHTPNHRWELASALARVLRHRPDEAVRARIDEWLAEGVDIDADGQYSERSANYAAHVSNPALLALGDILRRPDLHDVVERNLASTLELIHPDGSVETVHSRRQDQREPAFPVAPLLVPFRRLAVERGRGDFAWAAEVAGRDGIAEPQTVLADVLLDPVLARRAPDPVAPPLPRRAMLERSRLVVDRAPDRDLVVYGGSDVPRMRRIRSGLANNPTFLRMFAGGAVLTSVRLSRDFFGLGPFRAQRLVEDGDGIRLEERLEGAYYQPLAPADRRADGDYALVDEGRFAAQMAFDRRGADRLALTTTITVRPAADGVDLEIAQEGPPLPWALELAFADGGSFEGGEPLGDGIVRVGADPARYAVGGHAIEVSTDADGSGFARYRPGEDYEYLGGTDALAGPRAYVTGRAPGAAGVCLRRVPR
ncbi:hypothetical protein [Microbacterium karelineae]|uniref:hypothetical protein n=1 Tax=Microbacterium karelineae TaxID=2654283 RepID=UPI0012E9B676|nr:hypothetical protein [Microbacterium karelineae]